MGYEREMSARQNALDLVKKRDAIEAEMDSIYTALTVRIIIYHRNLPYLFIT